MEISNKRQVIDQIFKRLKANGAKGSVLKFNNDLVKSVSGNKFRNQFDITKCDTPSLLPKSVLDEGYFIVHLGRGEHAFVKGEGYHKFEQIKDIKKWTIKRSVIDDISESEAQSTSIIFNNKIIHDFLFGRTDIDIIAHPARRARVSYKFKVNGVMLYANALQVEMDGIYESTTNETIATIEAKNKDNSYFEVRQLFSAMKYCEEYIPKSYKIILLFLLRINKSVFNLYEYEFKDKEELTSIKFVKATSYITEKDS